MGESMIELTRNMADRMDRASVILHALADVMGSDANWMNRNGNGQLVEEIPDIQGDLKSAASRVPPEPTPAAPRVRPAFEAPTDAIRATEKHIVRNRLHELFQTEVELSPGQKGPWNNYGK